MAMLAQTEILSRIYNNEQYNAIATPVDQYTTIEDANFFLRKDGLIVNAEGWFHPKGQLIGEVLYVPDIKGNKTIFGVPYRKVTLRMNSYDVIPYNERASALLVYDNSLDQRKINPFFARYKQIFPLSDFVSFFSPRNILKVGLNHPIFQSREIKSDLASIQKLLHVDASDYQIGLTGSLALGQLNNYHDFDVMFFGTLDQNRALAEKMRQLIKKERKRLCFEGGKAWQIRFFDDYQKLMCCFFGYLDKEDIPLRDFEMSILNDNVSVEGVVCEDKHTLYTPTILELAHAKIHDLTTSNAPILNVGENLKLIIYHTATRGECYIGDSVRAKGALIKLTIAGAQPTIAVCVIEREAVRNLTPPWQGYYESNT